MLFRKWGCLVGSENSIFRKLKSIDRKKMPLTTEIILHFYFPFKAFPENERERERESAREREEKRRTRSRRREIAPDRDCDRRRERKIQDREISYVGERGRSEIAIDASWDRAVDCDLAKKARSRSRSWIAIDGAVVGLDLSSLMIFF